MLVVGDEKTTFSVVVCLLQAKHRVALFTRDKAGALSAINDHLADLAEESLYVPDRGDLEIHSRLEGPQDFRYAIVVNSEDLEVKRSAVAALEEVLPEEALIAINTESIPLSEIQEAASVPGRVIGANWAEPVHTTFFLEVIANEKTSADLLEAFVSMARSRWQKDPYVLHNDNGIRSRMISAMVREAFFLVNNDYVSIEDVDRACRNDPGYYLPFAGHCRYMDLMGTYVYGAVMKDLNPELSNDSQIAPFFTRIITEEKGEGIANRRGFYKYEVDEVEERTREFRKFSYEIRDIISKYPFSELKDGVHVKKKVISNA